MAETLKWIGEIHDLSMEFDNALLRYREALKWYFWLMNMNTNINKEATNQNNQKIQPTWLHQRGKMQKSKQYFKCEYYEQIEQLLGIIISVEESLLLSKESLFTV
uniref:KIF-binding protein n=1 Tax=Proboscia inermis TaxID=420281 RepID=A0A7S0CKK7_9STRA|mmetsp:Transcript_50306/g.50662  ORF Transcript_50306/g.50662 Transcript_50306/m.50662 type:complete len:105 (+) Transcript_50306:2-316(+)